MNFEEIEDEYSKQLEIADNEFVEGLKAGKDRKKLEMRYLRSVASAREKFYAKTRKRIANPPKEIKKKKAKEEVTKPLDFRRQNLELTFFQKIKYWYQLKRFKIGFWLHNRIKGNTPDFVSYSYIKTKMETKRASNRTKNFFYKIYRGVFDFFVWSYNSIAEKMKKLFEWASKIPDKIFGLFFKAKKKEEPSSGQNK